MYPWDERSLRDKMEKVTHTNGCGEGVSVHIGSTKSDESTETERRLRHRVSELKNTIRILSWCLFTASWLALFGWIFNW